MDNKKVLKNILIYLPIIVFILFGLVLSVSGNSDWTLYPGGYNYAGGYVQDYMDYGESQLIWFGIDQTIMLDNTDWCLVSTDWDFVHTGWEISYAFAWNDDGFSLTEPVGIGDCVELGVIGEAVNYWEFRVTITKTGTGGGQYTLNEIVLNLPELPGIGVTPTVTPTPGLTGVEGSITSVTLHYQDEHRGWYYPHDYYPDAYGFWGGPFGYSIDEWLLETWGVMSYTNYQNWAQIDQNSIVYTFDNPLAEVETLLIKITGHSGAVAWPGTCGSINEWYPQYAGQSSWIAGVPQGSGEYLYTVPTGQAYLGNFTLGNVQNRFKGNCGEQHYDWNLEILEINGISYSEPQPTPQPSPTVTPTPIFTGRELCTEWFTFDLSTPNNEIVNFIYPADAIDLRATAQGDWVLLNFYGSNSEYLGISAGNTRNLNLAKREPGENMLCMGDCDNVLYEYIPQYCDDDFSLDGFQPIRDDNGIVISAVVNECIQINLDAFDLDSLPLLQELSNMGLAMPDISWNTSIWEICIDAYEVDQVMIGGIDFSNFISVIMGMGILIAVGMFIRR